MFWNRSQAVEDQRKADVVERLLRGPIGKQLADEIAEDRRAERQALIDSIVETQAAADRNAPALAKMLREAEAELEHAERAVAVAREKRTQAVNAISSASSATERAIAGAQRRLRESADFAIEELVRELERAWDVLRNRTVIEVRSGSEADLEGDGPNQRVRSFVSYGAALTERLQLLRELRDEAAVLALTHAGDPSQAIADIRARMPAPDAPLAALQYTQSKLRVARAR